MHALIYTHAASDRCWQHAHVFAQGAQLLGDRTSTNAWCGAAPCVDSWAHVDLQDRLSEMLGTTPAYMEALQVLRYAPGQYYKASVNPICDNRIDSRCVGHTGR